jgi:signal transduction histidine kinase
VRAQTISFGLEEVRDAIATLRQRVTITGALVALPPAAHTAAASASPVHVGRSRRPSHSPSALNGLEAGGPSPRTPDVDTPILSAAECETVVESSAGFPIVPSPDDSTALQAALPPLPPVRSPRSGGRAVVRAAAPASPPRAESSRGFAGTATADFTSHTPVATVQAVADAVAVADNALQVLRTLHVAAASITQLLDSSLDVERIDSDRFALDARPCNVRRVFTDAVQQLRVRAAAQQVTLRLDLSALPPLPRVTLDRFRLLQAVTNLGTNAIKFVDHSGGGLVVIRVTVAHELPPAPAIMSALPSGSPLSTRVVAAGASNLETGSLGSTRGVLRSSNVPIIATSRADAPAVGSSVIVAVHSHPVDSDGNTGAAHTMPVLTAPSAVTSAVTTAAGVGVQLSDTPPARHSGLRLEVVQSADLPAERHASWLVVEVIDNGVGMSPDNLAKLFTPFTQFNAGKLQQGKGSGLGECACACASRRAGCGCVTHSVCVCASCVRRADDHQEDRGAARGYDPGGVGGWVRHHLHAAHPAAGADAQRARARRGVQPRRHRQRDGYHWTGGRRPGRRPAAWPVPHAC